MECTKVIGYKGLFHSESYQILLTLFLFIFEPFNRVDFFFLMGLFLKRNFHNFFIIYFNKYKNTKIFKL